MTTVKHMKWWGWGVEGVAFHHEDKPNFAPFVRKVVDLDVNIPPLGELDLSELNIPEPRIGNDLVAELTEVVGESQISSDGLDRVVHTYGKSLRDLVRLRNKDIPRIPDVIVYPADEAEVQQPTVKTEWDKTPRNAPCPCGSGKKFKLCHGR